MKPALESEVVTLKIRYKKPASDSSTLISQALSGNEKPMEKCHENIRFSSCVAEFGQLLRDSEFKGNSNFKDLIKRAKKGISFDPDGYRAEFIRLMKLAEDLK